MFKEKAHAQSTDRSEKQTTDEIQISEPGSDFEKEADASSGIIEQGGQLRGTSNPGSGLIAGNNSNRKQNMIAPPAVKERLRSSGGSGEKLSGTSWQFAKTHVGDSIDDVRIHTDSHADEMSESMNADAFTFGKDIYFRRGKFDTFSSRGKDLFAHELTHTKQENKNNLIQRKLTTSGGDWQESNYATYEGDADLNDGYTYLGATIAIDFKPDIAKAKADKIGLIQTVQTIINGSPDFAHQTNKNRSIKSTDAVRTNKSSTQTDEGTAIDQEANTTNPLYTTDVSQSTDKKLSDTGTLGSGYGINNIAITYQHADMKSTDPQKKIAKMYDAAFRDKTTVLTNSKQKFEVAAVGIEGPETGRYYGSVQWGWQTNSTGTHTVTPFKIVSQGSPSSTFMAAAEQWNKTNDVGGRTPIKVPWEKVQVTNTAKAKMYDTGDPLSKTFKELPLGTRIVIDYNTWAHPTGGPIVRKARVVDGSLTGTSGWISIFDYEVERDKQKRESQ